MVRRSHAAGLALAVLAAALLSLRAEEPKPADKPAAPDDKTAKADVPVDILATVKEWNSDKFAAPPTQFRQGNVTVRPVEEKATTATKNGFVIQLPSGAPIPTPSVYKDSIYVSGGFHSREYYCFDAETGKPVWGVNLDDDGPTSAACQDGVILFNTESCTIFALDAETGKQLWSLFLGDPLTNTPTIANGKVFTAYPALAAAAQKRTARQGRAALLARPGGFRPQDGQDPLAALDRQRRDVGPRGGGQGAVRHLVRRRRLQAEPGGRHGAVGGAQPGHVRPGGGRPITST